MEKFYATQENLANIPLNLTAPKKTAGAKSKLEEGDDVNKDDSLIDDAELAMDQEEEKQMDDFLAHDDIMLNSEEDDDFGSKDGLSQADKQRSKKSKKDKKHKSDKKSKKSKRHKKDRREELGDDFIDDNVVDQDGPEKDQDERLRVGHKRKRALKRNVDEDEIIGEQAAAENDLALADESSALKSATNPQGVAGVTNKRKRTLDDEDELE